MIKLRNHLRKYIGNKEGVAAIEAAIVFPILIMCIFAILGFGVFLFGTHQAQRVVEETSRQARVVSEPTKEDLVSLLKANMKSPPFGTYTPNVVLVTQFGGEYAELSLNYNFKFNFPLLGDYGLTSNAITEVKLREMPI